MGFRLEKMVASEISGNLFVRKMVNDCMNEELMAYLYRWDNSKSFLIVELNLIELTPNGGEIRNEEVLASEDAITRLFDLDLFGWQVKSYTFLNGASSLSRLKVEVYRRET